MNSRDMTVRCSRPGLLRWVAIFVLASLGTMAPARAQVAGIVKVSEGSLLIQRDGKSIPATVGTEVMAGDVLRTAADAKAGVTLKDDTRVSLGPNSQVVLDKFAFNANTHEGGMFVSVLKGTLGMISGLLVKANPNQVRVQTPTATIGIRGTEFIVDVP